ncbi:hypothetical protein BS78_08G066600 [Paspalum vaginatum]|nr:hypothetical protein BS78_08G066600 [Paspalum vaginatum]
MARLGRGAISNDDFNREAAAAPELKLAAR